MALSNWDTLAIALDGSLANSLKSSLGIVVGFYKNWLYIYDEKAWDEASSYDRPCVGVIQHGEMIYKDISIYASRGPQQGVYAVISSGHGDNLKAVVGCGVYAFQGEEMVGITEDAISYLRQFMQNEEFDRRIAAISLSEARRVNQGDAFFAASMKEVNKIATKPGEQRRPIVFDLLDRIKKS